MLRNALFAISLLSLTGCPGGKSIPKSPEIWQCAFDGDPIAWFCVNSETGEQEKRAINDPRMKGAQALSLDDYEKSESWLRAVIDVADTPCR